MKTKLLFFLTLSVLIFGDSSLMAGTTETGFYWPIGASNYDAGSGWWLSKDPDYYSNYYHIGTDMMTNDLNHDVYSIAAGKIIYKHCDNQSWGEGNCALFIEHKTSGSSPFVAVYGHLRTSLGQGSDVNPNQILGKTGPWDGGIHLHFGIHPGDGVPYSNSENGIGWGRMILEHWPDTNGFINPVDFIQNNSPFNTPEKVTAKCVGDICWEPSSRECSEADRWFDLKKPPYLQASDICDQLYEEVYYISQATNSTQEVPEEHFWQSWWRSLISIFGPGASADDIMNYAVIREIEIPADNSGPTIVIAGDGVVASDATGYGYSLNPTEQPDPGLPDFIVDELQLQTPSGVEQYQYETIDEIKMHAWFDNIGETNWAGDHDDMEVRFYLSKGYKEDAHDDWKHVGTDNIKKENIQISDPPKHEEEGLKLWEYHLEPGVYNIVACADRTKDQNNGDGDVPEEHKSNNCSTEAVFTVVEPNKDPYGHIDSVASSQINGWAKDDDSYDPTDVHVYKTDIYGNNSQFVESFPADDYRVDVDQHAFFWNVPGSIKDGIAHQLFFYAINSPSGNNPQIGYTKFLAADPIGSHYPVYRFYNSTSNSHFITISEGEKDGLVFNSSFWRAERAVFRALKTQEAGSVPVYRFYSGQEHFYTAFEGEKNNLIGSTYWRYEGVRFYAFPTQVSGTIPVYRLYNSTTGRHLFTASSTERDKCISLLGFRSEGIGWYAYPF